MTQKIHYSFPKILLDAFVSAEVSPAEGLQVFLCPGPGNSPHLLILNPFGVNKQDFFFFPSIFEGISQSIANRQRNNQNGGR